MSDTVKLEATLRTEFGKGAARRARRAGLIPAVMYGHGTDPVHLNLPGHATTLAVRQANVLLEISYEGKTQLALPKQVSKDPLGNVVEHVDLLLVKRGEQVTVEIPVVTVGDHGPETLMNVELTQLNVQADATKLPEQVEIDVTGIVAPHQILAKDVKLPAGCELADDAEKLVVNFTVPAAQAASEGEAEAAAAGDAEAAE